MTHAYSLSFELSRRPLNTLKTDCLCLGVFSDKTSKRALTDLANSEIAGQEIAKIIRSRDFNGKLDETFLLNASQGFTAERVLLIGLGESRAYSALAFARAHRAMLAALKKLNVANIVNATTLHPAPTNALRLSTRWFEEAYYAYASPIKGVKAQTADTAQNTPKDILVRQHVAQRKNMNETYEQELAMGRAIGRAINQTRFLGDLPANICTPAYLADTAEKLGAAHDSLTVHIRNVEWMRAQNMGALLAVAKGSTEPAKFIEIHYTPNHTAENATDVADEAANNSTNATASTTTNDAPIVLVGKGVTFDTGGISIKPARAMDEMKYDMCGAASVIGAMRLLAETHAHGGAKQKVIGLIPATENMPSGDAVKPGDVVRAYNGTTVEILNTDAEGRLILADALSYAENTFAPKSIVDIATLTGACVVALGNHRAALMGNDRALQEALQDAGDSAHDPVWPLPMDTAYNDLLKSNFADVPNISPGPGAGTITAACFLQRFIANTPWVHLDIAGVAWREGRQKGATGRPVPLLAEWLLPNTTPKAVTKSSSTRTAKQGAQRGGIGAYLRDGLLKGLPTHEILDGLRAQFPNAKTTSQGVASYALNLRKQGIQLPTRPRGRRTTRQ